MRTARRYIGALILGLSGCIVLSSLGYWQLQRLDQKETYLSQIETRITADPIPLPQSPNPETQRFLPVTVDGSFDGPDIPVFLSHEVGPIYRLVAAFTTAEGRRIMVDRGYIPGQGPLDATTRTAPMPNVQITGNLHWPDEVDSWTPAPDARGVYYGRDVATLAAALGAEPFLIIARDSSQNAPPATPLPVTTAGIPNNHLGYAVQWFGLAIVWAGMTLFLLWRIRRRTV